MEKNKLTATVIIFKFHTDDTPTIKKKRKYSVIIYVQFLNKINLIVSHDLISIFLKERVMMNGAMIVIFMWYISAVNLICVFDQILEIFFVCQLLQRIFKMAKFGFPGFSKKIDILTEKIYEWSEKISSYIGINYLNRFLQKLLPGNFSFESQKRKFL